MTLTPVAFFRASLALPFALVLGARLGRPPRSDRIPRSVLLAPLLFLPVAALAWLIFVLTSGSPIGHPVGLLFAFLPFAAWILVLGYLHVGLVIVLYALLRRAGIVRTRGRPARIGRPSITTTRRRRCARTHRPRALHAPCAPA
ncbi:MAG: hypothetical protein ACOYLX_15935 [Burkholderiaceae bacterium]